MGIFSVSVAFWQTYKYRYLAGAKGVLKLGHSFNQKVSNLIKYMKYEFSIYLSKWKYGFLPDFEPTFKIEVREYAEDDS